MNETLKLVLATIFGGVYGSALLYVYMNPLEAPAFALALGTRKAFLLSSGLEPTFFTLFMGVMMAGCGVLGIFKLISGLRTSNY